MNITSLQGFLSFVLTVTFSYLLIRAFQLRRRIFVKTALGVFFMISLFLLQCFHLVMHPSARQDNRIFQVFVSMAPWLVTLMLGTLSCLCLVFLLDLNRFRKNHISPDSIREALAYLPSGLLFYQADGRPLLVNQTMHEISRALSEHTLHNGEAFAALVQANPICALPDGRVFSFRTSDAFLGKKPVTEILAFDITEEYALNQKLKQDNERLAKQRDQLLRLGDLIQDLTRNKELLAAKVRIHDNLGSILVSTRHYLQSEPSPQGRSELVALWNQNIRLLNLSDAEPAKNDYHAVLKAAEDVGVHVHVTGNLPDTPMGGEIMRCAINECITNTFRHADGDALYIEVVPEGRYLVAKLTNNGRPPACEVVESGGLKNLRQLVESAGGRMQIQSHPTFMLTLEIPNQ